MAEASLVVDERKQAGEFAIVSRIQGQVYVTFTALMDNNSFVKETGEDISDIISEYLRTEQKKGNQVSRMFYRYEGPDSMINGSSAYIQFVKNCH